MLYIRGWNPLVVGKFVPHASRISEMNVATQYIRVCVQGASILVLVDVLQEAFLKSFNFWFYMDSAANYSEESLAYSNEPQLSEQEQQELLKKYEKRSFC